MKNPRRTVLGDVALAVSLLALAEAGCASQESAASSTLRVLRLTDSGGRVNLARADLIAVELEARPSAGFTWEVASIDESLLTLAGREHVSAAVLGGEDLERLLFKGVGSGKASLSLVYRRPWEEPSPSDPTYSLEVDVQGPYAGDYVAPEPESSVQSALEAGLAADGDGSLPARFNLCDPGDGSYNRCTPVKNQGKCGGCWAFATTGVFENLLYFANPSVKPDLSEQYLISCNSKGYSCAGGGLAAFDYYIDKFVRPPETEAGAVYTVDFPFKESDTSCGKQAHPHHEKLNGYTSLGRGVASVTAIKNALMTSGPVWTSVCADNAFSDYRSTGTSSIYRGTCKSINHAVVLVGWDDNGGNGYWHLRNSWGNRWGDKGYMRIAFGASSIGTDSYKVSYVPPNIPPVADAGRPQSVRFGDVVTLDGSASHDPDGTIVKYAWAQTGGSPSVQLSNASDVKPTFTAPSVAANAELTFTLTVTDDDGATGSSTVVVTVKSNLPPIADAGAAQTVSEGAAVELDGSASSDPDGTLVRYSWAQTGGPAVVLAEGSSAKPSFLAPSSGSVRLTFQLTVTDNDGATDTAEVTVDVEHINVPPVARAGKARRVAGGATVVLDGSGSSDPEGDIASYSWRQTAGAPVLLDEAESSSPTFVAPTLEASEASPELVFELTVIDGAGASATDSVAITVARPGEGDSARSNLSPFAMGSAGCGSAGVSGVELSSVPFALSFLLRRRRSR